ncbi:MAG: CBS domain-containing protein [Deltaproteobacteria bacterium]|nr:MAG: CBS domain-containing protein [Deltaproteobacteria bacterium]RLC17588.1 MAG: CBS domain-containing protein [Deltaproteobacteria bacterium]HHE74663.1 CBS domain-containing protein [Desulfobacteraceae bacterium]
MKEFKVVDLMVPLSEYATVSEDATLYEAVVELEKAQEEFDHTRYRHRAILVMDQDGKVVGKLTQLDALKALEPKYDEMLDRRRSHHLGFTKEFMKSMLVDQHLFASPLEDICRKAGEQNVKKHMRRPSDGEFIEENASLDVAIHQLVLGNHQSLLVLRQGTISGILRLTDVFAAVYHTMRECF